MSRFVRYWMPVLGYLLFALCESTLACTTSGAPGWPSTTNLNNLDIPRDLPVGAAVPGGSMPLSISIKCAAGEIVPSAGWLLSLPSGTGSVSAVAGLTNVYQITSGAVAGVGFRILDASGGALPIATYANVPNAVRLGDSAAGQVEFNWTGRFELVKVASAVSKGSQSIPWSLHTRMAAVRDGGSQTDGVATIGYSVNQPAIATCSVLNREQTVTLPTVSQSALDAGWGVAGATPFKISLSCSKGSRLYITLTNANAPTSTQNQLWPQGVTTTGSILIERADGSRVSFGPDSAVAGNTNQWLVADTPDGSLDIPLIAKYSKYSASSSVRYPVGVVTAKMTFTLSYQ